MEFVLTIMRWLGPWIVWLIDFFDGVARFIGWRVYPISAETVLKGLPDEARAEVNDPELAEPFRCMMADFEHSHHMHLLERLMLTQIWRDHLRTRSTIKRLLDDVPDVCSVPIRRPVFLIGLPRSGTTLLQRLMACDGRFFSPMLWEMDSFPKLQNGKCTEPLGRPENWRNSARFKEVYTKMEIINAIFPDFKRVHEMSADAAEECYMLMLRSCLGYDAMVSSPDFQRWTQWFHGVSQEHMRRVYAFYKKQLQLIGYNSLHNRRYLLKGNIHLLGLEALMEQFPDAKFVFSYRPLGQTASSLSALNFCLQNCRGIKPFAKYGMNNIDVLAKLANNFVRISSEFAGKDNNPFFVYQYKDILRDPIKVMRNVYSHIEEELTPEVEERMRQYLCSKPQHVHGRFPHNLEQYGLTRDMVAEKCKYFIDHFISKGVDWDDLV